MASLKHSQSPFGSPEASDADRPRPAGRAPKGKIWEKGAWVEDAGQGAAGAVEKMDLAGDGDGLEEMAAEEMDREQLRLEVMRLKGCGAEDLKGRSLAQLRQLLNAQRRRADDTASPAPSGDTGRAVAADGAQAHGVQTGKKARQERAEEAAEAAAAAEEAEPEAAAAAGLNGVGRPALARVVSPRLADRIIAGGDARAFTSWTVRFFHPAQSPCSVLRPCYVWRVVGWNPRGGVLRLRQGPRCISVDALCP